MAPVLPDGFEFADDPAPAATLPEGYEFADAPETPAPVMEAGPAPRNAAQAFGMAEEALPEGYEFDKPNPVAVGLREMGRGLASSKETLLASSAGGILQMLGDWTGNEGLTQYGRGLTDIRRKEKSADAARLLNDHPYFYGERFADTPLSGKVARVLGNTGDSAGGMLLSMVAPQVGLPLMVTSETAPMYQDMRDAGLDTGTATGRALLYGLGSYGLERFGLDAVMGKVLNTSKLAAQVGKPMALGLGMLASGAAEGGTELLQSLYQTALETGFQGTWEEFKAETDAQEVFWSAAAAGGAMNMGAMTVQNFRQNQLARGLADMGGRMMQLDEGVAMRLENRFSGAQELGAEAYAGLVLSASRIGLKDADPLLRAMYAKAQEKGLKDSFGDFYRNLQTAVKEESYRLGELEASAARISDAGMELVPKGEQGKPAPASPTAPAAAVSETRKTGEGALPSVGKPERPNIPLVIPPTGRWQAETPKGEAVLEGKWEVVDAGAVLTSDQRGYDQALQPRNREAQASREQIVEIATKLNPNRLADSATLDDGAPLVDGRGMVVSGNGRVMALREAYGMGTANTYREMVQRQAQALGVDTAGMAAPVLVRRVAEGTDNLAQIAEWSNRPKVLQRSAAEQAEADAKLLTPELLATLSGNELEEGGREVFERAFVAASADASLRMADGSVAPSAQGRIRNAMVAALAQGHPEARAVTRALTEDAPALGLADTLDTLTESAPKLLRMGAVKAEYDLRGAFGQALNELVQFARARSVAGKKGETAKKPPSPEDWVRQGDLLRARDRTADLLFSILAEGKTSKMAKVLDRYVELAGKIDTGTADMFGEANATPLQLLAKAAQEVGIESRFTAQADSRTTPVDAMGRPLGLPFSPPPSVERSNTPPGFSGPGAGVAGTVPASPAAEGNLFEDRAEPATGRPMEREGAPGFTPPAQQRLSPEQVPFKPYQFFPVEYRLDAAHANRPKGVRTRVRDKLMIPVTGYKWTRLGNDKALENYKAKNPSHKIFKTVVHDGENYILRFTDDLMSVRDYEDQTGQRFAYDENTFFRDTSSVFSPVDMPSRPPDVESDFGSKYWYTENGVIRAADHWGNFASVVWDLPGFSKAKGEQAGFASWSDFKTYRPGSFDQSSPIQGAVSNDTSTFEDRAPSGQPSRARAEQMRGPAQNPGLLPRGESAPSTLPEGLPQPAGPTQAPTGRPLPYRLGPAPAEGKNTPAKLDGYAPGGIFMGVDELLGGGAVARSMPAPGAFVELRPDMEAGTVAESEGWRERWNAGQAEFQLEDLSLVERLERVSRVVLPEGTDAEQIERMDGLLPEFDKWVSPDGDHVWHRPGYTRHVIELPELGRMIRDLFQGKMPVIARKMPKARGSFQGVPGGESLVKLNQNIFELVPEDQRARLMDQAIAEADKALAANPNLAPDVVEGLKLDIYEKLYNEAREQAKRRGPLQALKTLAHEIGHWIDFAPQEYIRGKGNILGHIADLSKYLKKQLQMHPDQPNRAMTAVDQRQIRQEARKRVRQAGTKTTDDNYEAAVSEEYYKIKAARERQAGLVTIDEVLGELEPVVMWWRGQTELTDYQRQPQEMYADLMSVFFLNPAELRVRAPKTWALLNNWLQAKPEVLQGYERLQVLIGSGQAHREYVADLRESFVASDNQAFRRDQAQRKFGRKDLLDLVQYAVDRTYGPIYRRASAAGREVYGKTRDAIARYRYRATEHEAFLSAVNMRVGGKLAEHGFQWLDLSEYMFHLRVWNERADLANPKLTDTRRSFERLQEMREQYGETRYNELEAARAEFRDLYEDHVLNLIKESDIFDPEMVQYLIDNEFYATFAVEPGSQDMADDQAFAKKMLSRYGTEVSGRIYKQIGTTENIQSPATATARKALSLISMAHKEMAKRETAEMLRDFYPSDYEPAEMERVGAKMVPVIRKTASQGTLLYLHKGEVKGAYVPLAIAEAFDRQDTGVLRLTMWAARSINTPIKAAFTGLNYGFWPVGFMRDMWGFARKMPGASLFGKKGFWRVFRQSWKSAKSSVLGQADDIAQRALRNGYLLTVAEHQSLTPEDRSFERLLQTYHQSPTTWENRNLSTGEKFRRAIGKYTQLGQISERTFKIAGMLYLEKHYPDMPAWKKREVIQTRAGSPDFLDVSAGGPLWDTFMLFYNPWKEGLRAEAMAFKDMGLTAWTLKQVQYTVLPKLGMLAAASGALGAILGDDEAEELRLMMQAVPEYDKTNYFIVPLGWADRENKKVTYIRLPLDEGQRVLGGLLWKATSGESQGMLSYAGGQMPGLNPMVDIGAAWWTYMVNQQNPYDDFTGNNVLTDQEFDARDSRAIDKMLRWTWNSAGGSLITRLDTMREPQAPKVGAEKFLSQPIISNLLGRWIKVSNRGMFDAVKPSREEVRRRRERDKLDVRDAALRGEELESPTLLQREYGERLEKRQRTRQGNLNEQILMSARNREEREAMEARLRQINPR